MTPISFMRSIGLFRRRLLCRLALRFPVFVRWLHTPRPFLMRRHEYTGPSPARDLFVFLPGIEDCAEDFERYGFVDPVRSMEWPVDMVMVDAHYGYYADRTILEELHEGVFRPAKACGYRRMWIGGISLGGFGALLYASRYPEDVTGVLAMAPFLGRPHLIEEIAGSGGLARWTEKEAEREDYPRQLWQWLRGSVTDPSRPQLYLAFGEQDIFVPAQRLLAASLPEQQVFIEPGTHNWPTWRRLWERFLRDAAPERATRMSIRRHSGQEGS